MLRAKYLVELFSIQVVNLQEVCRVFGRPARSSNRGARRRACQLVGGAELRGAWTRSQRALVNSSLNVRGESGSPLGHTYKTQLRAVPACAANAHLHGGGGGAQLRTHLGGPCGYLHCACGVGDGNATRDVLVLFYTYVLQWLVACWQHLRLSVLVAAAAAVMARL